MDCIDAENIKVIEVIKFKDIYNHDYIVDNIPFEERRRKVVFIDDKIIDFKTEEEIEILETYQGQVFTDLKYNTMYLLRIIDNIILTEEDLINANLVYKHYKEKEKLYKSKKLIKFPGKYIK